MNCVVSGGCFESRNGAATIESALVLDGWMGLILHGERDRDSGAGATGELLLLMGRGGVKGKIRTSLRSGLSCTSGSRSSDTRKAGLAGGVPVTSTVGRPASGNGELRLLRIERGIRG